MELINDFLNPKTIYSPAIAATLIMAIANTLNMYFHIPIQYSGLILSALFSYIVQYKYKAKIFFKIVLFILNTLLLFTYAASFSNLGNKFSHGETSIMKGAEFKQTNKNIFFKEWI